MKNLYEKRYALAAILYRKYVHLKMAHFFGIISSGATEQKSISKFKVFGPLGEKFLKCSILPKISDDGCF